MDYKELIENLERRGMKNGSSLGEHSGLYEQAAYAITDLLARSEEAEARAEKAESERDKLFQILNDVCRDVRAKSADKYVCGLCEYDVAYIGESGDWVNECPGFEKDDCFCMKKSMRYKFGQKEE